MSTKSSASSKSSTPSKSEAQVVKLPPSPAQPRPPPRADHSDFSLETLSTYLGRLEGWNPAEDKVEDEELYQAWIEWLDKALRKVERMSPLWIRTLRRLAATCRRSHLVPGSLTLLDPSEFKWFDGEGMNSNMDKRKMLFQHGQAEIFRAEHQGQVLAVKVYSAKNIETLKDFYDEIILWSKIEHRNIVPLAGRVIGSGSTLASVWMENGAIAQFLEANPMEHRRRYMVDIMNGVAFLHALGIIHADLKGGNILVDADKTARLADFGISTTSSVTHTQAQSKRGTEQYQAPEFKGGPTMATRETDFFSLAHVLAELFLPPVPVEWKTNARGEPLRDNQLPEEIKETCLLYPDTKPVTAKQIGDGVRPKRPVASIERPETARELGLTDVIWEAITLCWDHEPKIRWKGWNILVEDLGVKVEGFDAAQAQGIAAKIKEETPPPIDISLMGGTVSPYWHEWPHTYPGGIRQYLIYRELAPLLNYRRKTHQPIIDFSFHERHFLYEDSIRDTLDGPVLKATPIPKSELTGIIMPGRKTEMDKILYVDVKCGLIPGWRAHINSLTIRAGTPPPPPKAPVSERMGSSDSASPTGPLCGLLPRRFLNRSRGSSSTEQEPPKEDSSDKVTSAMQDQPLSVAASEPAKLAPPAGMPRDIEILKRTLKPVTIGDIFRGVYNSLHESISGKLPRPPTTEELDVLISVRQRRIDRGLNHLRGREKYALWDSHILWVDFLVDQIMFDGFVVTQRDDSLGVELELITREPRECELHWYRSRQL